MKLYNSNLSPFAGRVRIALYAKDLGVDIVDATAVRDYAAINPLGKVPCLEIEETSIPESETILEYLEDRYPEPSLHGGDAWSRAKVRLIARIGDVYIMAPLAQLFGQLNPKERNEGIVEAALKDIDKGLHALEGYFEAGETYAVDGRLTIADASIVPVFFFVNAVLPMFSRTPFEDTPKLAAYFKAVQGNSHIGRVIGEMAEALKAYQGR